MLVCPACLSSPGHAVPSTALKAFTCRCGRLLVQPNPYVSGTWDVILGARPPLKNNFVEMAVAGDTGSVDVTIFEEVSWLPEDLRMRTGFFKLRPPSLQTYAAVAEQAHASSVLEE